jgi:diguanylate cyclase (GGDEF)-like protein
MSESTGSSKSTGALDPNRSVMIVQLMGITYAAMTLPLLGAFLTRDQAVNVPWLAAGTGGLAVIGAVGARRAGSMGPGAEPGRDSPATDLALNGGAYLVTVFVSYGLSGGAGPGRPLQLAPLLAPLLLMAAIGTRTAFSVSCGFCLTALTALTALVAPAVASAPGSVVPPPAVIVVSGMSFGLAATFVRVLSSGAAKGRQQGEQFGRLASLAAAAETTAVGLDHVLPVAGRCLGASAMVACDVDGGEIDVTPSAAWPQAVVTVTDEEANDLRVAAGHGRVVIRDRYSCLPVSSSDGVAMVVLARCPQPKRGERRSFESAVDRVRVQFGGMLSRHVLIERLESLTRIDALTGLANRRELGERIDQEIVRTRRSQNALSVVMIDVDRFTEYNDSYGHPAGDVMLKEMAALLKARLRASDIVARYGGGTFCVVLSATGTRDAAVVCQELHRRCREMDAFRPVTFSAGVAEWDGTESIDELLARTDKALVEAKTAGRDCTGLSGGAERAISVLV